ncbi:unnamed protein product, partial [marine sediment metagenome]
VTALTDEFFRLLRTPKHGFGSGMNPCLDCRILMFSRARENLEEIGADFVFTGEVLGQRPMSQHLRAMRIIDRESGLDGRVLRPLSAKLLPPTIPERQGIVRREALLGIRGRSRREQMALAKERGIADYPCPAGGCRLAEPGFARRMRDLVTHTPDFDLNEVELLKVGRHFRLSPAAKAVVGRDEEENRRIRLLARPDDFLFEVQTWGSPLTLLRGEVDREGIHRAAAMTARYSDAPGPEVWVCYGGPSTALGEEIQVSLMGEQELAELRI